MQSWRILTLVEERVHAENDDAQMKGTKEEKSPGRKLSWRKKDDGTSARRECWTIEEHCTEKWEICTVNAKNQAPHEENFLSSWQWENVAKRSERREQLWDRDAEGERERVEVIKKALQSRF